MKIINDFIIPKCVSPTRDALESFRRASLPRHTTLLPKSSFETKNGCVLPPVRESAFRNPADFCLWNWESWKALHVESGILAPVVQKLDSAIHRVNCDPADRYYEIQLLSTLWTTGPWALESGIQLMKSRIPRMIGIQLSSTDKESRIQHLESSPESKTVLDCFT